MNGLLGRLSTSDLIIRLANYHFIMIILRRYLEISPALQFNKQSPLFGIQPEGFFEGFREARIGKGGDGELWGGIFETGVGRDEGDKEGDVDREVKAKLEGLVEVGERGLRAWRRFNV